MTDPVQDVIAAGVLLLGWAQLRQGRRTKRVAKKVDEVHDVVANGKDEDEVTSPS